jgi:hypothetical protein
MGIRGNWSDPPHPFRIRDRSARSQHKRLLLPPFQRLAVQSSAGEKDASMWDESLPNLIPARYLETLVARLQKEADRVDVKLPKDAALYIARNVRLNSRAMERALNRLIAYSSLDGTEISLAYTQKVLKSFINEQGREVALDSLPELTSQPFGTKKAKVRFHSPVAADKDFGLCLLEGRHGRKTSRVRHELEVNMRESERERLARRDAYERDLERHARKRKRG